MLVSWRQKLAFEQGSNQVRHAPGQVVPAALSRHGRLGTADHLE
ncbi:hypothetical protein WQQ_41740 [Hydrocarboniphaga effusa AP103]|uniref:Uncharacterized protein n=1 Tax=Hydrocarboniphaga effusa AP103 TaxID=1172194 RepID=I7Z7G2_9GAMM|nr:hypothetical protein WQQ_41740 [Hydrocarboniphaga effusa AP103]